MSDRKKEEKNDGGSKEKKKETETVRGERERGPEGLASTLPLLFASAADVVVGKGGKNLHKVIIIHMNVDQILENWKHTHTQAQITHTVLQRMVVPLHAL